MTKKKEKKGMRGEVIEKITLLLTAAFGFVAALQWNNWVKELIKPITESGTGHWWLFLIAVVVTLVAVLVAYLLGKASVRAK
ncbi:MAG: hypothetical protein JSW08_01790 [archaeon]|nr:MAG: hypothetical protein JSW08_01790 [archaeon]